METAAERNRPRADPILSGLPVAHFKVPVFRKPRQLILIVQKWRFDGEPFADVGHASAGFSALEIRVLYQCYVTFRQEINGPTIYDNGPTGIHTKILVMSERAESQRKDGSWTLAYHKQLSTQNLCIRTLS